MKMTKRSLQAEVKKLRQELLQKQTRLEHVLKDGFETGVRNMNDILEDRRCLEALKNAIPAGIFIADSKGKILEVNDYIRKIWGIDIPLSASWEEYSEWPGYNPETGRKISAEEWATSRALNSGEIVTGDVIDIIRFDGTKGTILNCAAPVRNEDDEIIGAVTINIDITKQREAERLLRQSSQKYQLLVESSVDLIWETDKNGRFTYLSPQIKKLWNIDPVDVLGKKPLDLVLPVSKKLKAEEVEAFVSSRQPFSNLMFNAMDGDGKMVFLEVNGTPVFDDTKSFQGYYGTIRDITRRVQAETALNESNKISNERLKEIEYLYLNLPIGLCVLDLDLKFLRVNRKLAEMNGIPVSDHIGRRVVEIVPSLLDTAESVLSKIRETGTAQTGIEFSGSTPARPGVIRTWSEDWLPIKDKNGNVIAINVMVVETTEQKKAEKEKIKNEERFKIIGEILPYGIWLCDNEGKTLYTSASFLDLLNMTMEEAKGFGWTKRLVAEDVEPMMKKWLHCLKTGEDWDHIHRIKDRSGNIRSVLSRGRPMRDDDGKIYSWAGINLDITERVEAEEQIKQSKEALELSQEKLKIALDNGNIGIWEWDLVTGKVKWDERMERMFGLEPGTFGSTHEGFENYVHEEDLLHIEATIREALTEGKSFEAVYRTKPRGGKSNYISSKALITRDNDNKPVSVSGVCFDVTDMKEGAERSLIALNEALLRSNNDLQQFAYVASHDLQEPLRMITSFTQLLQKQYQDKLDQKANEYINFAVEGSKRMYEMINGLLAFSRVQTKGSDFRIINLEAVVQKVRDNLMLLVKETGAEIVHGRLPKITGDENQLIQLLQNLIENGIKFCRKKPVIRITGKAKEGKHIITVHDNGIGIEPQYFDRVFRIFQRLHSGDVYKGTGIGLAISRRIVERHGGEIWVESVPGKGSSFSFSIPIKR